MRWRAVWRCYPVRPDSSDEENVRVDPTVELPQDVPPLKDYGGIGGAFALRDQRGEIFHLEDLKAARPCSFSATHTVLISAR